ncbi:MAG: CheR family methyltransferase [Devosia sp.]|jgi:chemotaxis protein methyltransferase CheR|nr:protein-glutamate O-methyltransferase CheR [Devosiaceae bacterium]
MDQGDLALTDREFERVKQRVYRAAGISLSDVKRTLVVSRLYKLVRARGLPSFDAYLDFLERAGTPEDAQDFVNALTTNLTRFYREDHHFEHLAQHVGALIANPPRRGAAGRPRLRIWSAGCSTGQEPYTIALCLLAAYPELKRWDFRILATDIDTNVLGRAASGIYPGAEIADLAPERAAPFERLASGEVRVPAAARELIAFKPLNLIEAWPVKGPFDAIFCRNVAIYFDKPTQAQVFGRFRGVLAPDGFLYIGHSENLGAGAAEFRLVGKTIYQPRPAQKARNAA